MRTSSATWPLFQDAHGCWLSDPWHWFHGCGCSSCVAPALTPTMQKTMFLHLDRRRASNRARNNGLDPAPKPADGASSLGFPSFCSITRAARDKNFDSLIHAFFCVSRFTNCVGRYARSVAHWLRSFRNNDNQRRSDAAILRRDLLCGSPDCLASARAMRKMSSPLRRPYSRKPRLLPRPLPRPSAVPTIRTAKGSIPITAARSSARHGIASIAESAGGVPASLQGAVVGNDPIDVSLTVLAPPRSLIPRWARTPGLRSKDGILRQSRGGSEFRCA
jgi:hypothetical protein